MPKGVQYHLTRSIREYLFRVLEGIFKIRRGKVSLRVTFEDPSERNWASGEWAVVIPTGVGKFTVAINPRSVISDSHLKGVCAHEAIHIAYYYYKDKGKLDKFWECLREYLPTTVDLLSRYYPQAEEVIACVLEPVVALSLIPSPEGNWEIYLPPEANNVGG